MVRLWYLISAWARSSGVVRGQDEVLAKWSQTEFVRSTSNIDTQGCLLDVLMCAENVAQHEQRENTGENDPVFFCLFPAFLKFAAQLAMRRFERESAMAVPQPRVSYYHLQAVHKPTETSIPATSDSFTTRKEVTLQAGYNNLVRSESLPASERNGMLSNNLHRFAFCLFTAVLSAGCNLPMPTPTPPGVSDLTNSSSASTEAIYFVNPVDGGSIEGAYDEQGRARVMVQVRVSGVSALAVSLEANGIGVLDDATNLEGQDPFLAEIPWYPMNGGGEYTLVASVVLDDKSVIQQTARFTVTGIPVFTPTPPPPDRAGAQRRISELIQMEHGVSIPLPAVFRFDDPYHPDLSRWIGSAYYKGSYFYVDLYDDTHYLWSGGPYSNRPNTSDLYTFCKPAGHYTVLVLFVDYNNLLRDPSAAVAAVPRVVDWLNGLYTDFARSQGLSSSPLSIEADAAFVGPPPSPGEGLTTAQILTLTGKDPADYDILMQIDIDPQASFAGRYFPGLVESGGGLALQGCGLRYKESINIWSSLPDDTEIEGALIMDFNHELSHLFGMQDNWPIPPGLIPGPSGQTVNDWIPYPMFGWTDADSDGVIEILDPTPYGTNGPEP